MKKLFTLLFTIVLATSSAMAVTYTVAGTSACVNGTASWDPTNTANDMTSTDGGLTYKLTVEGCVLEAGSTYQYKVCEDHAWTNAYPSSNAEFSVDQTGTYTVEYTFDVATSTPTQVTTRTGDATVGDKTYSIAGSSVELFGASWDQTSTATDMTKQADGTYKWTKDNVTLGKGNIQYKVVVNHSWDEAYPSSNAILSIPEDGTYDAVFTFDPTSKAVDASVTKTGTAIVDKTYTVVGGSAIIFGEEWNPALSANDMAQQSDGTYALTKVGLSLEAGDYEWKVAVNHAWDESYPAEGNAMFSVTEAGEYNITFTFNPTDYSMDATLQGQPDKVSVLTYQNNTNAVMVYNLQGQLLRTLPADATVVNALDGLSRGIYVVGGKKIAK